MRYLEAPNRPTSEQFGQIASKSIFLAGGITNVEDWQAKATEVLSQFEDLYILNPRRKVWTSFLESTGYEESKKQIEWEYDLLNLASQKLFWFSHETIQPIVLYELGARLMERKMTGDEGYGYPVIFVGVHPNYQRRFDVLIQTNLVSNDIPIADSLDGLLLQVVNYNKLLMKEKREGD